MKLFDDFIKSKEDHVLEKYLEDDEFCIDCTETHNTGQVKKKYVDELLHPHDHEKEDKK